jgi:hypothetical protein
MNYGNQVGLNGGARDEMEAHWYVCRALQGGTKGMREAGEKLTPKTSREKKDSTGLYLERLSASCLYNVWYDTVRETSARPFGKPIFTTGTIGPLMQRLRDNADRCGNPLEMFAQSIYQDGVARGMGMFLVDNVSTVLDEPVVDEKGIQRIGPDGKPMFNRTTMTREQAEQADARPYFARIDPDNFAGARVEKQNGRDVCVELRVREWAYEPDPQTFREVVVERIRRYTRTHVEMWQRNYSSDTGQDRLALANQSDSYGFRLLTSSPHGFPHDEIPLIVFYTQKLGFAHARPPLLDLAHLNVKHWNQQSVLDSTIRFCMAPILFARGVDETTRETPPKTGEGATLITTSDSAELRYVEIAGTSLAAAREEIATTERRMSGMQQEVRSAQVTATGELAADLRENSEGNAWIEGIEWALYNGFLAAEKWGLEALPQDFDLAVSRPAALMQATNQTNTTALQFDVREGVITKDTYRKVRALGGAYGPDFDPEAEGDALAQDAANKQEAQLRMLRLVDQEKADPDPAKVQDDPATGGGKAA